MKKIFLILLSLFLITSCGNSTLDNGDKLENTLKIETSIIPLASITNYIGGDFVQAKAIIPAGISPHGFDLKPQNMVDIENADFVIYLGLEHIDGFLEKAIVDKNKLIVSEGIELIEGFEEEEEEETSPLTPLLIGEGDEEYLEENPYSQPLPLGEEHNEDDHEHESDPHIWTSAENARIIARKIMDKLVETSPENKEYFEANLKNFEDELDNILVSFRAETDLKSPNYFLIFHDAYNYLFQEIGIPDEKKLIFQTKVLSDPNLSEMKDLVDKVTENSVKTAFKEPQFDDSNLKKFANEYNLTILNLDPLGKDESAEGYLENLKENLENLKNIYE